MLKRHNIYIKIFFCLTFIFIFFLTGCSFKELDDNAEIIVSNKQLNSIVFVCNNDNSCCEYKFITKVKEKDKIYLAEAKLYDGEIVYHNIIEDRDFEILNAYEDTIYVKNKNGIQKIVYSFPSIGFNSKIETDMIVSYKVDSYDELIKPINDANFLEIPTTKSNRLIDSINNEQVTSLAYYYDQIEFGATRSKYVKTDIYTYFDNENILRLYYHDYGYQIIKTISGSIKEDLPEKIIDINLFTEVKQFKTIKCAYQQDFTYIYLIDENDVIYCYDVKNNKMVESTSTIAIEKVIVVGKYLVTATKNQINILNSNLEIIDTILISDELLGLAWYNGTINKESLIYSVYKNNTINLNIYEIKEETK